MNDYEHDALHKMHSLAGKVTETQHTLCLLATPASEHATGNAHIETCNKTAPGSSS